MPESNEPTDVSKLPISPIRTIGGFHFLSGVVGLETNTELVKGGMEAELNQIFKLIKELLRKQNSELGTIFKTTVYIADMQASDFGVVNKVYKDIFGGNPELPVRTTIGVERLPLNAKVEVEAIAIANPNNLSDTENQWKQAREGRGSKR